MYEENKSAMINALAADLRKSKQESVVMEIDLLMNDVKNILMHIREWSKPEYVSLYVLICECQQYILLLFELTLVKYCQGCCY